MSELNAIIGVRKIIIFQFKKRKHQKGLTLQGDNYWFLSVERSTTFFIQLGFMNIEIKGQKVIHFVGLETFFLDILATANNDSIITAVNIKVDN